MRTVCLTEVITNVLFFRRIRELNENNTKKFIEERKRQAVIQSRRMEVLKKIHAEQMANLIKDMERVHFRTGLSVEHIFQLEWS